jgi:hypothetical protein
MDAMDEDKHGPSKIVVNLRALVMAGAAVSPLYLWSLVDFVGWYAAWSTPSKIIFEVLFEAVQTLLGSVGVIVVALGGALLWHRGRVQPFSFALTSLAVLTPFIAVDTMASLPSLLQNEANQPADVGESYFIVVLIIRQTTDLAAVALASRLYATWSSKGTDVLDARRCLTLGVVVGVLAIASTINSISLLLVVHDQMPDAVPLSVAVLQTVQHFLWSLMFAAGPIFLFGLVAILTVRRRGHERSVGMLVLAGLCAAVAYVVLEFGREFGRLALQDPSFEWLNSLIAVDYNTLIAAGFAGVGGAIIYAFAIDGTALLARLRALPSTISRARNRPLYAPDEDGER